MCVNFVQVYSSLRFFIHACSYLFNSRYLQPTTLETAVENHATRARFLENIDSLNTIFDLNPSFESTGSKIDAAVEAFSTPPIAGDEFSDAEDYTKNDNEDDDLNFGDEGAGNEFSDAEDYAKSNEGSDVEEDCIE